AKSAIAATIKRCATFGRVRSRSISTAAATTNATRLAATAATAVRAGTKARARDCVDVLWHFHDRVWLVLQRRIDHRDSCDRVRCLPIGSNQERSGTQHG